jgi:hypothetical protein
MSNRCRYLRLANNSTSVLTDLTDPATRLTGLQGTPAAGQVLVSVLCLGCAGRVGPRDQQTPPRCARNPVAESRSALRSEAQAQASNKPLRLCWHRDRVKLNGMYSR